MSAAFTQTAFHLSVHNFVKRSFSKCNILYATKKMKQKKGFNTQAKHKGRHQKFNLKKTSEFGNEFLYGRSACNLAILSSRRPIFKMFLNSKYEVQEPDDPRVQSSLKEAAQRNIPIEFISAADMFDISSGHPHQGVCLEVGQLLPKPLCQDTMNQLLHHGPQCPLWVLLYDIIDPMNIGNILRTCHFLGVKVPIMTSQCAPISPTTSKASSGAVEVMQLYSTNRPTQFITELTSCGWDILGTDAHHGNMVDVAECDITKPSLLIIGSEGKGVPVEVKELCTKILNIKPMTKSNHDHLSVPCLNVSAATAIILHQLLTTRKSS